MSAEIILYTNAMSRGRIAHWMLEEVGVPYRVEWLDFDRDEQKSPAFLALNPMGKLPTLVHRGVVISEAAAICTYLADAFPGADLAPALEDSRRGSYLRWMFFGAGCFEPALLDKTSPRANPTSPRSIGYGSYADVLNAYERALQPGPYILGKQFSAADVYVGSQLGWGLFSKMLEPRPAFLAYLERLHARPAFARMNAQCAARIAPPVVWPDHGVAERSDVANLPGPDRRAMGVIGG
jgi:glutathione S-transferase